MLTTSNYALKKPEGTDIVNINDFNFNADTIDKTLKGLSDGKANASHGNHVPTLESANNARFLRNDDTWQTINPTNIGAVPSSSLGSTTIQADSDSSSTTEYASLKAGGNELKITSSGGGSTPTKSNTSATLNGNALYHTGNKPNKSDVGLSNVDNTADMNKPISTAIQTALNGKSSTSHNHTLASLSEKSYNSLTDKPASLPANGGNADTVDGKHASDFVTSHIVFDNDPSVNIDSYNSTATWIGKVGDKVANRPTFADWCTVLNIGSSNNSNFQIGGTFDGTNRIGYRCRHDTDSVYGGWKRILNEDDYNSLYNLANNSKVSECVPTTMNGWVLGYHFCVTRIGNAVTISGNIRPGTLTNETDIFQLPNGFKPYADSDYVALCPHLNNDTRQNSLVYFRVLTSGRCFYIGSNPAITNGGNTEIKLEFTYRGV